MKYITPGLKHLILLFLICEICEGVVELHGAGASFPADVYTSWMIRFRAARSPFSEVVMTYQAVGSGAGKSMIKQNDTELTYAGSDSLLSDKDYQDHPDLKMFPTVAGAVVAAFNLPGVRSLNLTRQNLVDIFMGNLTSWDDMRLQISNPNVQLPSKDIIVVARKDKSGTTEIFTSALSAFSPVWAATYGTFSAGVDPNTGLPVRWNPHAITYYGLTNRGSSGIVLSFPYSLTYLSVADASKAGLDYAMLQNSAGKFVLPNEETLQSAMDYKSEEFDKNFNVRLVDPSGEISYPIAGYTYLIIRLYNEDCETAHELYRYIEWFTTDKSAVSEAATVYFVSLSSSVIKLVREKILMKMICKDRNVHNVAEEAKARERLSLQAWRTPLYIGTPFIVVLITIMGMGLLYQHIKENRALIRGDWKIPIHLIKVVGQMAKNGSHGFSRSQSNGFLGSKSSRSGTDIQSCASSAGSALKFTSVNLGRFGGGFVCIVETVEKLDRTLFKKSKREMLWMQEKVRHDNVARFLGATEYNNVHCLVSEYWSNLLVDVLQNDRFDLDNNLRFSISLDLAQGMSYLHKMGITHGNLTSSTCCMDHKWTLKITDWFHPLFAKSQGIPKHWRKCFSKENELHEDIIAKNKYWTPPELLKDPAALPEKETDSYSFAVILIEIFTGEDPYFDIAETKTPFEIITSVMEDGIRPTAPPHFPPALRTISQNALDSDIHKRPDFYKITQTLKRSRPSKKGVLDCMMEKIENYMSELEQKVEERTLELKVAMKGMEELLHQMLPPSIATKLTNGETVTPEQFDDITIYFSDIVGFTALSAMSSAIQIVDLLNDLYSTFDAILDMHDVYKVETIGDAYMVSSGLPKRNGITHAGHIALMALQLMTSVHCFKIRHMPEKKIKLRIGIHTGPVCAGVVGLKMPRYCLFGDTVNTASRMESTSLPMKIQMSETTANRLDTLGGYIYESRGGVEIKGKGTMNTYWLVRKESMTTNFPLNKPKMTCVEAPENDCL